MAQAVANAEAANLAATMDDVEWTNHISQKLLDLNTSDYDIVKEMDNIMVNGESNPMRLLKFQHLLSSRNNLLTAISNIMKAMSETVRAMLQNFR